MNLFRLKGLVLLALYAFPLTAQENLLPYVNPFIGTGGHGHTFPGPVMPFGMVQLSPDTRVDGSWDGCGGYHYSDSVIYGFSHTHLSGTGCSDYGDVMLMPMKGKGSLDPGVYASKFSHTSEKASAGYYQVTLSDEKIHAELTATPRVGIHRYTFPSSGEAALVLNLKHRDKLLKGEVKKLDNNTLTGYRISEAWAKEQHCYFALRFSQDIKKANLSAEGAILNFNMDASRPLLVKVGISGVSQEGALANLNQEAPHWDFESYRKNAEAAWNRELNKVLAYDQNKERLTCFYTALYHCFIHPSLNMDADRKYRGRDQQVHSATHTNYSVFSLWDTYRTLHPLFNIIAPEKNADFIQTFLVQYQQANRLPVWELSGNETDCMIGYHAVSVIADALAKGNRNFDAALAYEAMKAAATYSRFGISTYGQKKFLTADDEAESVSRTLEYAYDDWCIAQMAKHLNRLEDYNHFLHRAQGWKNLFDPSTGFMRPRRNGDWLSPFDPREVNNHFTEGNSWQYSFYVPQDINTLIEMHGGDAKFETRLDSLFSTGSKTTGREQADITGLIGQYAHGNEPSHHMAYLYVYCGAPHKTQSLVYRIQNEFYKNTPDGLIGNEDCGQMSAWYVMSAMGFYPVCPGSSEYAAGRPLFDSIIINLPDNKRLGIYKQGGDKPYVNAIRWKDRNTPSTAITHNQLMKGGKLLFVVQDIPDLANSPGRKPGLRPAEKISYKKLIPAPLIIGSKTFEGRQELNFANLSGKTGRVYYSLDETDPGRHSEIYMLPVPVTENCTVKARIFDGEDSSACSEARFFRRPNNWEIRVLTKYNPQYTAGGDKGLIDGIYGETDWRKGDWQGYQYQDLECIIDLKEKKPIQHVAVNCLQDTRSWILFPSKVEVLISDDALNFTPLAGIEHSLSPRDYTVQIKKLETSLPAGTAARYVKLVVRNFGKLPEWHEGRGDGAFIFADEIEIR